jgi:predicted DNA-binding protein YlxM (UPF0122 family)
MPPRCLFGTEISGNTSKQSHLSPAQRQTIIAKFDAGVSVRQLADEFEHDVQTIRDTIKRRNLHQTTSDLPRSGRKPMLSLYHKKLIYQKACWIWKVDVIVEWDAALRTLFTSHLFLP